MELATACYLSRDSGAPTLAVQCGGFKARLVKSCDGGKI
jgi:hypothetical protein